AEALGGLVLTLGGLEVLARRRIGHRGPALHVDTELAGASEEPLLTCTIASEILRDELVVVLRGELGQSCALQQRDLRRRPPARPGTDVPRLEDHDGAPSIGELDCRREPREASADDGDVIAVEQGSAGPVVPWR